MGAKKKYVKGDNCMGRKLRAGVKDRAVKIITDAEMTMAELVFWRKRGFLSPPGVTMAGIMPSAKDMFDEQLFSHKGNNTPEY